MRCPGALQKGCQANLGTTINCIIFNYSQLTEICLKRQELWSDFCWSLLPKSSSVWRCSSELVSMHFLIIPTMMFQYDISNGICRQVISCKKYIFFHLVARTQRKNRFERHWYGIRRAFKIIIHLIIQLMSIFHGYLAIFDMQVKSVNWQFTDLLN